MFIEHILFDHNPKIKWSVKNQARMHLRNNHQSYNGIESALIAFPETCSALAIGKKFEIIAPYGFIDLFNFRINPTKFCIDNEPNIFINRVQQKKWKEIWPNLILNEKIMKTIPYVENSNLSA